MLDTGRGSVNNKIYLWPRGIVPYVLESSLSKYIFVYKVYYYKRIVFNAGAFGSLTTSRSESCH